MLPKVGDIYCVFSQQLQQYVACQVTALQEESSKKSSLLASILVLDWIGETLPDEATLHTMKPLVCDFYFWNDRFDHSFVSANVPPQYSFVGNIPPLVEEEVNTYSSGWDITSNIYSQHRWNQIDPLKRERFKSASSDIDVTIGGQVFQQNTNKIDDRVLQAIDDLSELDKLPSLTAIHTEQGTQALATYINQHPFINEIQWKSDTVTDLDLSNSNINRFMLKPDHLKTLHLNNGLTFLIMNSHSSPDLHIHDQHDGKFLDLQYTETLPAFDGLNHLGSLSLVDIKEIDILTVVKRFPHLAELRIWGKPGTASNIESITRLTHLQTFTTYDLFGFTAEEFPAADRLSKLSTLWMTSVPADVAKMVKTEYKKAVSLGLDLSISQPRKPEWLAENLANPFRDWDGREHISTTYAKKAAQLYKKMLVITRKIDTSMDADTVYSMLETMVTEYTEAFNQIDRRTDIIETVEREEIYTVLQEVLVQLQQQLGEQGKSLVNANALYEHFDNLREF